MIIEIKANELQNFEERLFEELFTRFKKDFSNCGIVGLNRRKVIRFPLVWSWFKNWRFNKNEANYIIKKWEESGCCKRVPYSGIKLPVGD